MPITLFDSLTRQPKVLAPSHKDGVFRFYNCGPTVYAPAHIGNFRTFVVNDVLRRLLELEFGPDKVKHVRNLTDVDDKTIRRSREENRPLAEVTKQWTDKFHADCDVLNCLRPHVEPAATDPRYMREQVNMIEVLMEKGNAYRAADGSVYFKVSSFDGYGSLSRVKERELQLGSALAGKTHAADADEKEDMSDFALWKAWKAEDGPNKWPGPRGASEGRPGWHIECSAMSKAILGDTIDLHTGGVDLLFPHHENEIAQSECCNGTQFARHWYHSEHLLVDGRKMSKSLGNLYTLDDLKKIWGPVYSPMAVRYALLQAHPRKQLNFTLDAIAEANKVLTNLSAFYDALKTWALKVSKTPRANADITTRFAAVADSLKEDLNFSAALGALFTATKTPTNENPAGDLLSFESALRVLGLKLLTFVELEDDALALDVSEKLVKAEAPADVKALAEKRWAAKAAKDFKAADALRAEIAATGWTMLDRKDGYSLEPAKK